jgi:hypothetical protein
MNDVPDMYALKRRPPLSFADDEQMLRAAQMVLPDNDPGSLDVGDIYKILKNKPIKKIDTTMQYETLDGTPAEIMARLQLENSNAGTPQRRHREPVFIPGLSGNQWHDRHEWGLYRFDALHKLTFWIRVALLVLLVLMVIRLLKLKVEN